MSIETNPVESDNSDLDTFSADFFGQTSVTPPAEETKEDNEIEDDRDATTPDEGDTQIDEDDDTLAPDDDNDEDSDETEEDQDQDDEPQPKKKNRFQERINEFTRELRETQRQLEAIKAENEKLKQNTDTPTPATVTPKDLGPTPDDTNEDGTEKYPLGEYDPLFVRDIARFTFKQEMELAKAEEAQASEQRKAQEQIDKLGEEWTGKLATAQERYPDLTEKGENLVSTFEGIDQAYGEYLSSTIMGMEYGPDVLYYLANNVDEAERIVRLGATGATIALGRIESKFADADNEKQKAKPRVSKAPTPPPTNRGSAVAMPDIPADTDNLDDFEKLLFSKKSRRS